MGTGERRTKREGEKSRGEERCAKEEKKEELKEEQEI